MKKILASLLIVAFCISMIGCATIKVSGNAQLAPNTSVGEKIASKRVWYLFWGLVPLNNNSTDSVIPPNSKVRVETKYTPLDFIFNIFTSALTINSFTAEVYEVK